ncbi:hypothetical protein AVEN_206655-1 [Araneus ventricosus]|uniref:Uncharacterized protein n=1 Tax=Araneus ventricosus TaxID=182803 RepID=A0A4Y2H6R3_ARAVE|nr:hypothetical protein AVEN_206655-1 [Araneus ventricosus]
MVTKNSKNYKPTFPVEDIHKQLKKMDKNVPGAVAVFIAAAEEYLAAEIVEKAAVLCRQKGKGVIGAADITEAIKADNELKNTVFQAELAALCETVDWTIENKKKINIDLIVGLPSRPSRATDGSKINDQTGSAFCAIANEAITKTWKAKLSPANTVFQEEMLTLKAAIEWANTSNEEMNIWSDSESNLQALKSFNVKSKITQEAQMTLLENARIRLG